jgi:hypothetical protein
LARLNILTQIKWHFAVSREFTAIYASNACLRNSFPADFYPPLTIPGKVCLAAVLRATAGHDRQKMSLRELKVEFKQTEDDPAIKGKMEQVRQVRRRRRMIACPKSHCVNKGVNITWRDSPRLALAPIGRLKALRDYGKS